MFKQDSESIKQLLGAEKKAEERINQARKRKFLRLKQAKEDARSEIEDLRQEKDKEFKAFESKFLGEKENIELKADRETEKSLKELNVCVKLNKEIIINYLLDESSNPLEEFVIEMWGKLVYCGSNCLPPSEDLEDKKRGIAKNVRLSFGYIY